MKSILKTLLLSVIPTFALANMILNIPLAYESNNKVAIYVGVFSIAFAISFVYIGLTISIYRLEKQVAEMEIRLKKLENKNKE